MHQQFASFATRVALGMTLISHASPGLAESTDDIATLSAKFDQSLKVIDQLNARVEQLEKQLANQQKSAPIATTKANDATVIVAEPSTSTGTGKNAFVQQSAIDDLQNQISQLEQSVATKTQDGLPIHGFLDAGFSSSHGMNQAGLPQILQTKMPDNGFFGGSIDLFLTPSYGRIKSLAELVIDYKTNYSANPGIDMERLQIGYAFDNNTIWLGRFHTPFGYWNNAYHHGAELQPSLSRPQFLQFEDHDGVLPIHSTGGLLEGKMANSAGKLIYDVFIANGKSLQTDGNNKQINFNPFTDTGARKAAGFRLAEDMESGLQIGIHGYVDSLTSYTNGTSQKLAQSDVKMLGGYILYDTDTWSLLSEYYHFDNTTKFNSVSGFDSAGTHKSNLGFLQVGYTINGNWFPYVRYEKAKLDQNDVYFAFQNGGFSYDRALVGLRYNFDSRSAFKIELSKTKLNSGTTLNTVNSPTAEDYSGANYKSIRADFSTSF